MKILILSFYYSPDLSAGSFRCTSLVEQLKKEMPDVQLEVITTLPNRYSSFSPDALAQEDNALCSIRRIKLTYHQSGISDQSRAFYHYAKNVLQMTKNKDYDLIFATSSRLMTAVLGAWLSKQKKIPLYLDIRDLFVDTLCNIMPKYKAYLAKPILSQLERWTFKQATCINLVSLGFQSYVERNHKEKKLQYFSNGIDEEFISLLEKKSDYSVNSLNYGHEPIQIVYAGNIGEGQGLHRILPELAHHLKDRVVFKIIGDGGRLSQLKINIAKWSCSNIELIAPVDRKTLMGFYKKADVLFLHLNHHDAFKKVLPSKLFEYAALGKPIWAGVSGYAADFIYKEIPNAAIFSPCNVKQGLHAFSTLKFGTLYRQHFIEKYRRKNIMHEMVQDIKKVLYQLDK